MKNNKILSDFKKKKVQEFTPEQKEQFVANVLKNVQEEFENKKDRFIFVAPDIDIVNPLVKLIYDLALECQSIGFNTLILHEKEPFEANWLTGIDSKYKDLKVAHVRTKVSNKSNKLRSTFEFKLNDSLFIPDIYLELIQDLTEYKEMQFIQKNLIVTGYSTLYTLDVGKTLSKIGINNCIFFDTEVQKDIESLFDGYKSYKVGSYKIDDHKDVNLKPIEGTRKMPYILISAIGNNEKVSQIANIFYNKYPVYDFVKIKLVNRTNLAMYLYDVSNAMIFLDLDKQYVTNTNALTAWNYGIPYLSTNGLIETLGTPTNNLAGESTDLINDNFLLAELISKVVYQSINSTEEKYKSTLVPSNDVLNSLKGVFETGVGETLKMLRDSKIENFNKLND